MPTFLTILNLAATFGLIVGGLLAYHYGFARTATEVQERNVITSLANQTAHSP